MLALVRRVGEKIIINGNIVVEVVSASRDKVKLAFDAPKDIKIVREELLWREKNAN